MNPFDKSLPSVFIICSPFQALCAMASIRELSISKYKILLLAKKNDIRKPQITNLLDLFHIQYEEKTITRFRIWYFRLRALRSHKNGFSRLFIGDIRNNIELYVGANYIKDNAPVVYLDDGAATIAILKDKSPHKTRERETKIINWIAQKRKITLNKNLLTIYNGINNASYNIRTLSLDTLLKRHDINTTHEIILVGTNITNYCNPKKIDPKIFVSKLEDLVIQLKKDYSNEHIVYIPHGRDKSEYAEIICKKYDCEFRKIELPIEIDLLNRNCYPKTIYGFTSSALYTLKKIYPNTKVINILYEPPIKNKAYYSYEELSIYYQENGIELLKETVGI